MSGFVTSAGVNREIGSGFVTVNGVLRKISEGYVTSGGIWRKCYQSGIPLADLPSGSLVLINLNNVPTTFMVVHHGLPSDLYDESCNGTWLLMKDLYKSMVWNSRYNHNYAESNIHTDLNSTFLGMFDSAVQALIKQVKIPYFNGTSTNGGVVSGADGLSAKIFIPSASEISVDVTMTPAYSSLKVGSCLDYFSDVPNRSANAKRIAYLNSVATIWYTRTPEIKNTSGRYVCAVTTAGALNPAYFVDQAEGVRPMMILPSGMTVKGEPNADGSYTLLV